VKNRGEESFVGVPPPTPTGEQKRRGEEPGELKVRLMAKERRMEGRELGRKRKTSSHAPTESKYCNRFNSSWGKGAVHVIKAVIRKERRQGIVCWNK